MESNLNKHVSFSLSTSQIYKAKATELINKLNTQSTEEFYQWFRNYSSIRPKDLIEHRILFFSCIGEKKLYTLDLYFLEQVRIIQNNTNPFDKIKVINDIRNNIIANLNKIYISTKC